MKVTKEITFDVAHMLSYYEGKCANLHGHTYKLQVTLESDVDKMSHMVLDFNILKEVLNKTVMDRFDHAVVFSDPSIRSVAEEELFKWAETYGKKYAVIPNGKTTCEDMAPYIKQLISEELEARKIKAVVSVRLWETPTSFAEC